MKFDFSLGNAKSLFKSILSPSMMFSVGYKALSFLFRKLPKKAKWAVVVLFSFLLLFVIKVMVFKSIDVLWVFYSSVETVTVNDIERNGTNQDLVYAKEGVFVNEDSTYNLKRNSSDLRNQLIGGGTFTCETQGFRMRIAHLYPNLIKCTSISEGNALDEVGAAETQQIKKGVN